MKDADDLVLYMFAGCPYCHRVQAALKRIGVQIEERDIHQVPQHRADLIAAMGRKTVPVLRIDGEPARWLPESADIVAYLQERYGVASLPFSNPNLERLLLIVAILALLHGLGREGDARGVGIGIGLLLLALSEAWRARRWDKGSAWGSAAALTVAAGAAFVL